MTARGWYTDRTGARYVHVPLGAKKRKSVRLACDSDEFADVRATTVRAIAATLINAGHASDAEDWARKAAEGDDERARRILNMARGLASGAERKTKGDALSGVTFKGIADDWTSGKLAKEYPDQVQMKRTADDDVSRLAFLCGDGGLGDIPIAALRIEHAEEAMRRLPERCRTPATRRHYAQTIRRVLELAVYPLRLIPANPLPRGFLPKPKQVRALQMPYPDEEAALLRCTTVDLAPRVAYGFLARMGFRKSEATGSEPGEEDPIPALTWDRLDLDRGVVFMCRSKTEKPRPLAMPPDVTRALAAWRKMRPNHAHVFADAADAPLVLEARVFRSHLRLARVTRAELHTKTKDSLAVRVHDLRALFVTTSLAQGKSETWIRDHTAHRTISMLDKYRRQARMFEELNLGALAPLDAAIPELAKLVEGVGAASDAGAIGQDRKGGDPAETSARPPIVAATGTDEVLLSPLRLPIPPLRPGPTLPTRIEGPSREPRYADMLRPMRRRPIGIHVAAALLLVGAAAARFVACASYSTAEDAADAASSEGGAPATDAPSERTDGTDAAEASAADAGSRYRAEILAAGPIAYWRMGVRAGSFVPDETGNGRALILLGPTASVPGAIVDDPDTAIRFDGLTASAELDVDASRAFDFPAKQRFSLECWAKREEQDGGAEFPQILGSAEGPVQSRQGYLFYMTPAVRAISLEIDVDGDAAVATGDAGPPGAYAYFVVTFDGAILSIYLDGALVATHDAPTAMVTRTSRFQIAAGPSDSAFPGAIDEVAVYDRVLGIAEIARHHDVGRGAR